MTAPAEPLPQRDPRVRLTPREHWEHVRANPSTWLAAAHNLVPVAGILLLGWSGPLVLFAIWFDGFAALAATVCAIVPRAHRETEEHASRGRIQRALVILATDLILVPIFALPYWFALAMLHEPLIEGALVGEIAGSPALWLTFGAVAVGHFVGAFRRGYDALPERELRQSLRWDVYLLFLRALAMLLVAEWVFPALLVPVMALVMTYMEVFPANVLFAVFGDPARLHELDPENPAPPPPASKPGARSKRRRR